jgi:hypothetical protein
MSLLLVPHRGGPSELHEDRKATLGTLAILTGHVQIVGSLPGGLLPDVLRLRPSDGSLFVGDAKATETPGNSATFGRLEQYARALERWVDCHGGGVLALVVAAVDAYRWLGVLSDLGTPGGPRARPHVDLLDTGTAVVWESLRRSALPPTASRPAGPSSTSLSDGGGTRRALWLTGTAWSDSIHTGR